MSYKPYSVLRTKIILVTICFSLIPLFALGFTIYYQFNQAYSTKIKDSIRALAENESSSIDLFFEERISQLITVANTHTLDKIKDEGYLKHLLQVLSSRSKSFVDIGVIDDNGNHLAYVGPYYEQLKNVNYKETDWFSNAISSGIYVSNVFLGFRRFPHFIIAVAKVEGNRSWILRATINSDIIDKLVLKAQLGKKGDAFIIDSKNILQTNPRFSGKLFESPRTPDFSRTRGTHVEEVTKNGDRILYASSQITIPKWVLVVKQDATEEMHPLFEARYLGALVLTAGFLLVVTGALFTSRSMINELLRMEKTKAKSDELLMQSSKMAALGKMAAGIAHEINNPLAIIGEKAGWMQDLLDKEDVAKSENWQEIADCIKKIERQVERSRTITHRLLRFGRRMEPTQDLIDVNAILSETLTFLENEAHYREISIETTLDDKIPRITTDSAQLQQVFLNIINNGIDAIGRRGRIQIITSYLDGKSPLIQIDIEDNGPGISKEVQARIFEPFFTTKGPSEGTGLGLSISYSIMEKLGGRIEVKSEVGEGTTFSIFVPAVSGA